MGMLEALPFGQQALARLVVLRVTPWGAFVQLVVEVGGHEVSHEEKSYGHTLYIVIIDGGIGSGHPVVTLIVISDRKPREVCQVNLTVISNRRPRGKP